MSQVTEPPLNENEAEIRTITQLIYRTGRVDREVAELLAQLYLQQTAQLKDDRDKLRNELTTMSGEYIAVYMAGRRAMRAMETYRNTLNRILEVKGAPPFAVAHTIAKEGLEHPHPDLSPLHEDTTYPASILTAEELEHHFRCIACGTKTPVIDTWRAHKSWRCDINQVLSPLCPDCGQRLTEKKK